MSMEDELRAAGVPLEPNNTQSQAFLTTLSALGYTFRLNLCDDSIEINGGKISDIVAARIRVQMRDRGVKNLSAVEDAYTAAAETNAYHPIKDYLNTLTWDETDHIGHLASRLTSADPPITYANGVVLPLHAVYLYRWLLGAVAKALDGEQNAMLVIDGPQGIGKSQLVRWLCPVPGMFVEGPIKVEDKDNDVRLANKFVWEVSELDATTRKADVSALKAFITKGIVTVRKAYGRHDMVKPALCNLAGTVNNSTGFLADETGSRRFFITRITAIDWSYTQLDLDQIWAQATHLYLHGERHTLTPEEKAAQRANNQNYEVETPLEDWLDMYLVLTDDPKDTVSMGEIIDHLGRKDIRLSGGERAQAMEIGRILTRMGATKVHTRAGKRWGKVVLKHS